MSTISCPNCNLVNWSAEPFCKRCGFQLNRSATGPTGYEYSGGPYPGPETQYPHRQPYPQPSVLKTGLALASMIMGIVALPTSFILIGLLIAPAALILGIIAIVKANRKPLEFGGKGFAVAGIATSSTALLFIVPIIAAIAIPNLLAARRAANEGSAISSLRVLYSAQYTYYSSQGAGTCGDLRKLAGSRLIDEGLGSGTKNGYRFDTSPSPVVSGCDVFATPLRGSDGSRSFMISAYDGVVRGARKNGLKAESTDPSMDR